MVVIRYLAGVTLMSALVAGCAQSLFDANPGDDEDSDGGPPDRIDASQSDARDGDPDAGIPVLDCPGVSDCVGDAVAEFATNENGPWRYVEVGAREQGFDPMNYQASRMPPAWVGESALAASIVNCAQQTEAASCSGLADRLLIQPSNVPEEPRPALAWIAPKTGTYRLIVDWRLDDTQASELPAVLQVTRNSQLDHVLTAAFNASTEVATFPQGGAVDIDVVRGDSIALISTARALADTMSTPLGVRFYVSDLKQNDNCQMAFQLDGQGSYPNACGNGGALIESVAQTSAVVPPLGIPGAAREFAQDSLLAYDGAPNNYNGDWTLQFWAKLEGPGEVLSDLACTADDGFVSGGIAMEYDGDAVSLFVSDEVQRTDCAQLPQSVVIGRDATFMPEDWHFYRIVRNRAGSMVSVCVDGLPYETIVVPPEAAMATNRPLGIGNTTDTPRGSFIGQLADLRLYNRALPCILAPP